MLKKFVIIIGLIFSSFTFSSYTYGKDITIRLDEGTLTLADFLDACEEAGESTSSKRVHTDIPGKIVTIKGTPYEVRFFSFEDTSGKLAPDTTFRDYANQNNLLTMKSIATNPKPGINFESFDCRKNPRNDGVYFSMAVKKLENGDN